MRAWALERPSTRAASAPAVGVGAPGGPARSVAAALQTAARGARHGAVPRTGVRTARVARVGPAVRGAGPTRSVARSRDIAHPRFCRRPRSPGTTTTTRDLSSAPWERGCAGPEGRAPALAARPSPALPLGSLRSPPGREPSKSETRVGAPAPRSADGLERQGHGGRPGCPRHPSRLSHVLRSSNPACDRDYPPVRPRPARVTPGPRPGRRTP